MATETPDLAGPRSLRITSRFKIWIRRAHLYAGLFLLPWVFLYGITGAMYNHIGLLPETVIRDVPASALSGITLNEFPSAELLVSVNGEPARVTCVLRDGHVSHKKASLCHFHTVMVAGRIGFNYTDAERRNSFFDSLRTGAR